jgi:AmpD protein
MSSNLSENWNWSQGWLRSAKKLPSPNFGSRPLGHSLDVLVLHSISLPPGQYGTGCVQRFFRNELDWTAHPYFDRIRGVEVSSHFFIERTGMLWQFVSCDDRAWHAGESCFQGRSNCNDFSIGVELEGLEGDTFCPEQYDTLRLLCSALLRAYPIRFVTGHEDIAPGRKSDPGMGFDWHRLQEDITRSDSQLLICRRPFDE